MKKKYSKISIMILTCIVILILCSCDLFVTDKDKFFIKDFEGDKIISRVDIEKTSPDIVVPEKVGDDVVKRISLADSYYSNIDSLDVSNVKELERFRLELFGAGSKSKLKKLDFSKNKKLVWVVLSDTKALKEVIFNENCESIGLYDTAIKSLNLKGLKKLDYFTYNGGPLEEIDISNNPNLEHLRVLNNNVKVLDVSNNPKLKYIEVDEGTKIIGETNAHIEYRAKEKLKKAEDN